MMTSTRFRVRSHNYPVLLTSLHGPTEGWSCLSAPLFHPHSRSPRAFNDTGTGSPNILFSPGSQQCAAVPLPRYRSTVTRNLPGRGTLPRLCLQGKIPGCEEAYPRPPRSSIANPVDEQ